MASSDYDVVVLGAGPGGYVAAIRAAQLGLKTAVVEKDDGTGLGGVGGVCLNWGCIPSKTLLRSAELVHVLRRGQEFGFSFENFHADLAVAVDRSRKVAGRLVAGVKFLLKKNSIDLLQGFGTLASANRVEIPATGQVLNSRNVVVATGARPRSLPGLSIDDRSVITSREALELRQAPRSLVIVGGGAVGVEFAYLFNAYGSRVTILEMLPRILPGEDEEMSRELEKALGSQGISILTGARVEGLIQRDGQAEIAYSTSGGGQEKVECDAVLLGVGVQPNSDGLGLEQLGVATTKGFIQIDERMETNVPGVYALGDVTGKLPLAHVASAQGVAVAEAIAGREVPPLRYEDMPRATYCQPQVASLGLTEAEAQARGAEVRVGRFPFRANGKALALGEVEGLVKIVVDARDGGLLGAHLIGPDVTELLAEVGLLKTMEGTPLEMAWTVHAHPTLSEVVKEATLATRGEAIHI